MAASTVSYLHFFKTALHLNGTDLKLLRLLFAPKIDPQNLADIFARFKVDELRQEEVSLLSQLCIKANYQGVPPAQRPRMKGVSRYFVTLNARQTFTFLQLAELYAQAGIEVLLCKGIAMRLGYMKDQSRHMWDVDIAVRPRDYERAVALARQHGYAGKPGMHATTLEKEKYLPIDLHSYFHKTSVKGIDEGGVWQRSRRLNIHGQKLLLPGVEDILAQLLTNAFSNIVIEGNTRPHLKWIYDAGWLIRFAGVSWPLLFKVAQELRVAHFAKLMLLLLEEVLPGTVNMAALDKAFPGYENNNTLFAHYYRSAIYFKRYFSAKQSGKLSKYILLWPGFCWHYHRYYQYGLPLAKQIELFPQYIKTIMGARSWWGLPLASINKIALRMKRDRELC